MVLIVTMRRKVVLIKNDEARLLFSMLTHPVRSCEEISEKKRGSLPLCGLLVLLFYIFSVLQILAGGFLFTYYDPESFNSFWVLVRSAGVVGLWIVCNWMVCTLLGGRGRLREITVVTCYSLLPLIIEKLLLLVLTNVLLPAEAEFLGILDAVAVLFMLVILVVGMIKIHDFSMSRFIGTGVLTLLAMAAMVFLIIMVGLLLQQLYAFIATVCMELLM